MRKRYEKYDGKRIKNDKGWFCSEKLEPPHQVIFETCMSPNFSDQIERMSPSFQAAYTEGFEDAKSLFLTKLRTLCREIENTEPLPATTRTV